MKFFDLHCDTVGECFRKGIRLCDNNMHIDLKKGSYLDEWHQTFAVWIPDELRKDDAFNYFKNVYDYYKKEVLTYKKDGFFPILSVEGGAVLGGDIKRLEFLKECGVRMMTLTWNGENEIAYGAGCSEGGLKPFGKDVIKEMENLGITVDVSHLNKQSFFDVAEVAEKPIIATHSNSDIVENAEGHRRNLTDEQIKIIKEKGGIIGLNLYNKFLEDETAEGANAVIRQINHFGKLDCLNILAFGSDFDGCFINDFADGIEKIGSLCEMLNNMGVDKEITDGMFFNTANSFFG